MYKFWIFFILFTTIRSSSRIANWPHYRRKHSHDPMKFGSFWSKYPTFEIAATSNIGEIPFHSIEIKKNCPPEAMFSFFMKFFRYQVYTNFIRFKAWLKNGRWSFVPAIYRLLKYKTVCRLYQYMILYVQRERFYCSWRNNSLCNTIDENFSKIA